MVGRDGSEISCSQSVPWICAAITLNQQYLLRYLSAKRHTFRSAIYLTLSVLYLIIYLAGKAERIHLTDMSAMDAKFEYEYLIKYKNLSYLHLQWLSATEIGASLSFLCV
jgi:hypothetical protein